MIYFGWGLIACRVAVWLGDDRKCSGAIRSRFRFVDRVIYVTAALIN